MDETELVRMKYQSELAERRESILSELIRDLDSKHDQLSIQFVELSGKVKSNFDKLGRLEKLIYGLIATVVTKLVMDRL